MKNYEHVITEMEQSILDNLSQLDIGYGRNKWAITEDTGIPEDVLTVLLKRLKYSGKVQIINLFREYDGMTAGSAYRLSD